VRVGLAHGETVAVHGDRYGPTVNLAARLVGVAEPGTIVVSESVRTAAADAASFSPIDPGPLRGFPDVTRAFVLSSG
jgi:adenylate cyclase